MAPKAKVSAKKPAATSAKSKPKGLQLSAAQWKAYNQAYTAVAKAGFAALRAQQQTALRRQQFAAAVQRLRATRLKAAASLAAKAAARHAVAQRTAIAAYAAKQSARQAVLGHQNAALRARVQADFVRHVSNAQRAQYAYKGVKAYAHTAVMRTLTDAQAASAVQAQQAKAAGTARAAVKSVSTSGKQAASPAFLAAAAKIRAQAQAAGLAAAASVPAAKRGRPRGRTSATKTGQKKPPTRTTRQTKTAGKRSTTAKKTTSASIKSAKKPAARVVKAGRTAPRPVSLGERRVTWQWQGDPDGRDCVAAAIANSLWHDGHQLGLLDYLSLVALLGEAPAIEDAMAVMTGDRTGSFGWHVPRLLDWRPVPLDLGGNGLVIGFETENGPHAALYLGDGMIASWGEVLELEDVMTPGTNVEECWDLTWEAVG